MKYTSSSFAEAVVTLTDLTRRFGSKTALDKVSLYVPRGCVFGLVGENGAGKTTLIKHLLGLLAAQAGGVRVFGLYPVADPKGVLGQIGYLSEQPDLPGWMRVDELMRYTQAFYPKWDMAYAERLREQFGLVGSQRIKTLSKGQLTKAALLAAQGQGFAVCLDLSGNDERLVLLLAHREAGHLQLATLLQLNAFICEDLSGAEVHEDGLAT